MRRPKPKAEGAGAGARFPRDPDLLSALAAYARDAGDTKRAQAYTQRLAIISPPAP
jgi:hypothetical protein